MTDASKPFAFSQFVPGFDFLKNLAAGSAGIGGGGIGGIGAGSGGALPGLSSWVAPTLSVEEVDKRIQELKTVQYWLEQNGHALKATIQALEVQKMTLSTLRGMNVRMEDIASAFTRAAAPAPAAEAPASPSASSFFAPSPAASESATEPETQAQADIDAKAESASASAAGVVDPLKWWGSLTQQFQEIAASALHDAAQLKMPVMPNPLADAADKSKPNDSVAARKKAPAARKAGATSRKSPTKPAAASRRPAAKR
ncbi:hypothetical protein BH11PSE13_BH11PSE13_08840 [soil metagenome]